MHGHGAFSSSVTIYFRGDVTPLLRGRNLSVIYVNNPVLRGFFRFEKPSTAASWRSTRSAIRPIRSPTSRPG